MIIALTFFISESMICNVNAVTHQSADVSGRVFFYETGRFIMKMKKVLSIALAAVMTEGLAAVPAKADDTWRIGVIGPLTGAAAQYGLGVANAAQIAVDEINEAGGINGFQIEYKSEDDELDPEKSVNAYNHLKDNLKMQFLVGSVTSGCSIAVSEKTKADNMFQLTPSGSAAECVKYDNVFRVCFSDPNQGKASAEYIGSKKLATKVGIIYDSSDVYSSGIEQTFIAEAANWDYEVLEPQAFTADSNTDFSSQLQMMKDNGADLIFLPIYYTQAGTILTQAAMMGVEATFFGCDGLDGMLDMDNFQKQLAEGVMLLTPFVADADDELTKNFVAKYEDAYKATPNQFAADSYDAIYAIKAALEDAGATPDMSVSDLCEAMKASMVKIELSGLTGTITWSADGEPTKDPKAMIIKDGAYTAAE